MSWNSQSVKTLDVGQKQEMERRCRKWNSLRVGLCVVLNTVTSELGIYDKTVACCLILSSPVWFTRRQVSDISPTTTTTTTQRADGASQPRREDRRGETAKKVQRQRKDEEHKVDFIGGPPSDLDTPGPSSAVHKYHRPLNEQWRHKSIEMKLQMIMLGQRAPKAFIFCWG